MSDVKINVTMNLKTYEKMLKKIKSLKRKLINIMRQEEN